MAGFGRTAVESDKDKVMKALEEFLRPEFLNRVDDIVVFNRLTEDNIKEICKIMLGDLEGVLKEKDITFRYTDKVVDYLAEKGYSQKYGARNLRRLIQTDIEDEIASNIINCFGSSISAIAVDVENGAIKVTAL